jgi:hypothetical protein
MSRKSDKKREEFESKAKRSLKGKRKEVNNRNGESRL